ncbi:MAG: alpha-L-fucosidase [Dysgonamonadaceae bacterium]|jgi:alpha-L-fucosidase|nr:alpha-L-fucosidase [Dysgonamonadaceae bacterium]
MKKLIVFCFIITLNITVTPAKNEEKVEQNVPEWAKESPEEKTKRLEWWTNDRFGMFIHWGLYSMGARHEWLMHYERIQIADYKKYFDHFNPDLYDPSKWAKLAKEAGMKYVVVGTKHHEGFCMFDSKFTDYKVTNTPYGKDLIRELVDAFRAEGLRIGFYYSLIDWHHPDFPYDWMHPECPHIPGGTMMQIDSAATEKANQTRDMQKYQQYMKNQITELLTNYGQIDELFLDFSYYEKRHKQWDSEGLLKVVRSLQPQIIVDDRLDLNHTTWGWDFVSPEQVMPENWETRKHPITQEEVRVPWETCQTFSGSWGYHRDETSWKSNNQLITMLIEVVSKGGNLLLNVGPTSRGILDYRAQERLSGIAKWMEVNNRSIYGCTQAPEEFQRPQNTMLTYNAKNKILYIHVLKWPTFKSLILNGYKGKINYAQLLNDGSEIQFRERGENVELSLPLAKPDTEIPVIEIFLK